jgi:hypothetical protein
VKILIRNLIGQLLHRTTRPMATTDTQTFQRMHTTNSQIPLTQGHTYLKVHMHEIFVVLFLNFFLHLSVTNRYKTEYNQHF